MTTQPIFEMSDAAGVAAAIKYLEETPVRRLGRLIGGLKERAILLGVEIPENSLVGRVLNHRNRAGYMTLLSLLPRSGLPRCASRPATVALQEVVGPDYFQIENAVFSASGQSLSEMVADMARRISEFLTHGKRPLHVAAFVTARFAEAALSAIALKGAPSWAHIAQTADLCVECAKRHYLSTPRLKAEESVGKFLCSAASKIPEYGKSKDDRAPVEAAAFILAVLFNKIDL